MSAGRALRRFGFWVKYGNQPDDRGRVIPPGPGGWPPEQTIVDIPIRAVWFYARWVILYAPPQAWHRFTTCRSGCSSGNWFGSGSVLICTKCGRSAK